MERYDYNEAVKNDVLEYINSEIDFADFDSLEELKNHLHDVLWDNDSVTGNGSGSYFCNSWKAEEAIAHNLDLLADAKEPDDMITAEVYGQTITAYCMTDLKRKASMIANKHFNQIDTMKVSREGWEVTFHRINKKCPNNTIVRGQWK